ncbi:glutathione-dependent formaldehyde-activating gfa [Niveomyces insectorum RCEF 264]|uniref:Glutathione-dependent formaldehyde-activating gfa n=1 Tax=Niveomyces insectorum RCEF 264 TaxID=1081102 RepID=A0A168A859_9HYPO|nr:glutathione-dependent formaldehyde-activating gfa [Niveomyces insectorum RCEF 264]
MTETNYRANCHCGKFVYEVTLPEPVNSGFVCNCSICHKKGYVFAFPPAGTDIRLVKGQEDELSSYEFGGKYQHKFCGTCGSALYVQPTEPGKAKGLNIRCFQGPVDVWTLKLTPFDGAALPPAYKEPAFTDTEPTGGPIGDDPAAVYHGSCHCGAVRLAVRCKPLDQFVPGTEADMIVDCNCSIGAYRWIYPAADQVAIQDPDNNRVFYVFGKYANYKVFCRRCGVHIGAAPYPVTEEELAALPEIARSDNALVWRERSATRAPVNTRVLHGIEFDKLVPRRVPGYTLIQPPYVNP